MSTYLLQLGENIFDAAIAIYGNIAGITNLIVDNNISVSGELLPGAELQYSVDGFEPHPQAVISVNQTIDYENVLVEPNQNIFDIAIQELGGVDAVIELAKINNISFSSLITAGFGVKHQKNYTNKPIVNYFKTKPKPATGSELVISGEPILEGIGYWIIEETFIVS